MINPTPSQPPIDADPLPPTAAGVAPDQKKRVVIRNLVAVLIGICIYIPFFFSTQPVRVGDGSEYYAMGVSWAETHRPYMTGTGWDHYDLLYQSNAIPGINSTQQLRDFAPHLIATGGQDFNHFWFYSLGAAVLAELGDYSGLTIPIHTAFLMLHCLLLISLLLVATHFFGWQGLLTALLITLLSPIFWYLDKVHTEFFTFALTSIAVIYFLKRRYFASSFCLALAATQNISFLLISLFVLAVGVFRHGKRKLNLSSILLIGATIALNALHPLYYLLRYGVLSPQFLSGSARAGLHLSRFWIWLLDPDVGLLPNWWIGCVILLVALFIAIKYKWHFAGLRNWLLFTLVFLMVSLLAQSSTINLNSGASPGPSRYALWYLCLFFPALLLIVRSIRQQLWIKLGFVALVLLGGVYSVEYFLPTGGGTAHCQPSALSWWLQKYLPGLYDPPAEVFSERYGGVCENIASRKIAAIIGPDCQKVYLSGFNTSDDLLVTGAFGCYLDFEKVGNTIQEKFNSGQWSVVDGYYHLTREEIRMAELSPQLEVKHSFALGNPLTQSIGPRYRQWGLLEDWGFWSVGHISTLQLPCPEDAAQANPPLYIELELEPFIFGEHTEVHASIKLDGQAAWSGTLTAPQVILLPVPPDGCEKGDILTMRINVSNPASRAELGISGDMRQLGVGLRRMRYTRR